MKNLRAISPNERELVIEYRKRRKNASLIDSSKTTRPTLLLQALNRKTETHQPLSILSLNTEFTQDGEDMKEKKNYCYLPKLKISANPAKSPKFSLSHSQSPQHLSMKYIKFNENDLDPNESFYQNDKYTDSSTSPDYHNRFNKDAYTQLMYLDSIPSLPLTSFAGGVQYIMDSINEPSKTKEIPKCIVHNVYFQWVLNSVLHKVEIRNQYNQLISEDKVMNLLLNEMQNFNWNQMKNRQSHHKEEEKKRKNNRGYGNNHIQSSFDALENNDRHHHHQCDTNANIIDKHQGSQYTDSINQLYDKTGKAEEANRMPIKAENNKKKISSIKGIESFPSSEYSLNFDKALSIKTNMRNNENTDSLTDETKVSLYPQQSIRQTHIDSNEQNLTMTLDKRSEDSSIERDELHNKHKRKVQSKVRDKDVIFEKTDENFNRTLGQQVKSREKPSSRGMKIANEEKSPQRCCYKGEESPQENNARVIQVKKEQTEESNKEQRKEIERNGNIEGAEYQHFEEEEIDKKDSNHQKQQNDDEYIKQNKEFDAKEEYKNINSQRKHDRPVPSYQEHLAESKTRRDKINQNNKSDKQVAKKELEQKQDLSNEIKQRDNDPVIAKERKQEINESYLSKHQEKKTEIKEMKKKKKRRKTKNGNGVVIEVKDGIKSDVNNDDSQEEFENEEEEDEGEGEEQERVHSLDKEGKQIVKEENSIDRNVIEDKAEEENINNEEEDAEENFDNEDEEEEEEEEEIESQTQQGEKTKTKSKGKKAKEKKIRNPKQKAKSNQTETKENPEKKQTSSKPKIAKPKEDKRNRRNRNSVLKENEVQPQKTNDSHKSNKEKQDSKPANKARENNKKESTKVIQKVQTKKSKNASDEEPKNQLKDSIVQRVKREAEIALEMKQKEIREEKELKEEAIKKENTEKIKQFLEKQKKSEITIQKPANPYLIPTNTKHNEMLQQLFNQLNSQPPTENLIEPLKKQTSFKKINDDYLIEQIKAEQLKNEEKERRRKRDIAESLYERRSRRLPTNYESSLVDEIDKKNNNSLNDGEADEDEDVSPNPFKILDKEVANAPKTSIPNLVQIQRKQQGRKFANRNQHKPIEVSPLRKQSKLSSMKVIDLNHIDAFDSEGLNLLKRRRANFNKNRWRVSETDDQMANHDSFKSLFEKIKELRELNPSDFALEMEKLIDQQVDNTDYALKKKEEDRLNHFVSRLDNYRIKKKNYRLTKLNGLTFKSPLEIELVKLTI